jgi:hypothetical protein
VTTRFGPQPVKDILYEQGWSFRRAALAIGVKDFHLYNAISGRTTPSPKARAELPKLLNRPLEELFTPEVLAQRFWHRGPTSADHPAPWRNVK